MAETPVQSEGTGGRLFLGFLAVSLAALWAIRRLEYSLYSFGDFIDLKSTAAIADSLPQDEDEFILSAWRFAAEEIDYEALGTEMVFYSSLLKCRRCLMPSLTLRRGQGNCVSKSALLVSLLRHRLPADRVYMAIGIMNTNGQGGHAWVELQGRDGRWYILEATTSVTRPMLPVNSNLYIKEVLVNDQRLICYSQDVCQIPLQVAIENKSCSCRS